MPGVLSFVPLFPEESEEHIRARWRSWANEGLTVDDVELWTDTREGSWWWLATTPGIREAARMYDMFGREVPASAMPQFAWGTYLDSIGESRKTFRLAATPAEGFVTFTGEDGTVIPVGVAVGVEPTEPGTEAPSYLVTAPGVIASGEASVPVSAEVAGVAGNVSAGAVTVLLTPAAGLDAVVNDSPMVGGTDLESDEAYSLRIVETYAGAAAANQLYYRRVARGVAGVGRVTVIPAADGPGTISVIVSTADGDPVSASTVTALQLLLDPVSAQGSAEGQVGADITVMTTSSLVVDLAAIVEFDAGYGMDSGGGVVGLREVIEAAVAAYIDTVEPGSEVVIAQVVSRIAAVPGVHDVGSVTLNGSGSNLLVDDDPPLVPTLGSTVGLVEGAL